jgi:hypothetical protein
MIHGGNLPAVCKSVNAQPVVAVELPNRHLLFSSGSSHPPDSRD